MTHEQFVRSEKIKAAAFLRHLHKQACFEVGDHPEEVDTAFSYGAEAIATILNAVVKGELKYE